MELELKDVLYEKDGKYYFRDSDGKIRSVIRNKYNKGQIVKTIDSYYAKNDFVMVYEPSYKNGWLYGYSYINKNKGKLGGGSWWHNEENLEDIVNPIDKLFAERIYRENELEDLESRISTLKTELKSIKYSLSISSTEFKNS